MPTLERKYTLREEECTNQYVRQGESVKWIEKAHSLADFDQFSYEKGAFRLIIWNCSSLIFRRNQSPEYLA